MTTTPIPEHMQDQAEYFKSETYTGFSPEFYKESTCTNCLQPIYRYEMDIVIEWKHFNHRAYCITMRATPVPEGE